MNIHTWRTPGNGWYLKNCHPSPLDTMTSRSPHRGGVAREFGSGTQFRKVKEVVLKPSWRIHRYLWHTGQYRSWFPWKAPARLPQHRSLSGFFLLRLRSPKFWLLEVHLGNGGRCSPSTVYWSLPRPPSRYTNNSQGEHAERACSCPNEIHIDPWRGLLWSSGCILTSGLPRWRSIDPCHWGPTASLQPHLCKARAISSHFCQCLEGHLQLCRGWWQLSRMPDLRKPQDMRFPCDIPMVSHWIIDISLSMSVELNCSNPECVAKAHHHLIIMKLQVPDFSQYANDIWWHSSFWNQKVLDEIHDLGESSSWVATRNSHCRIGRRSS